MVVIRVIPATERLRQEDDKFKAILGQLGRHGLKVGGEPGMELMN